MKPKLLLLTLLTTSLAWAAPDEELLGKSKGYPIGTPSTWFFDETVRVGSFSNQEKIDNLFQGKANEVLAGGAVMPLPKADKEPNFRWHTRNESNLTIDDFLNRQRVTGLLVIKDGVVQVERYQYDRTPEHKFLSNSMAKSILSLAVGFAVEDKLLDLSKPAQDYAPTLKGTLYGETTLVNLLRMSSGVRFTELYNGKDDLARYNQATNAGGVAAGAKVLDVRETAQGEKFHYASAETEMLALVLRSVISTSISEYLSSKLWKPMGAERSAFWRTNRDGLEKASGNFNATLRDYGRLGVVLANDGMRPDTNQQVISRQYLDDATRADRQPEQFRPMKATPYFGYGYQFWTFPTSEHRFALQGVYGQVVYVDPKAKLVMVMTAVNKTAKPGETTLGAESIAFWRGLVEHWSRW